MVVALSPTQYISPVLFLYTYLTIQHTLLSHSRIHLQKGSRVRANLHSRVFTTIVAPPSFLSCRIYLAFFYALPSASSTPLHLVSSAASSPRRSSLSVLFVRRRCSSYVVAMHGLHRAHSVFNTQAKVKNARVQSGATRRLSRARRRERARARTSIKNNNFPYQAFHAHSVCICMYTPRSSNVATFASRTMAAAEGK